MAITLIGTNGLVASGQEKVSDRSLVVTFTAATQVGDKLYLGIAWDNSDLSHPTVDSVTDSRGNTWNQFAPFSQSSTATAAAGVVLAGAGCHVTTAHQIGDTLTIAINAGSPAVTAKAGIVVGLRGVDLTVAEAGAASNQATSGSPALSPGSTPPEYSAVVGFVAHENSSVATGDSDTTNGSWSTAVGINTTGGSAATNVGITAQVKVVTAAGAQTWNPTTTSDWAAEVWYVQAKGLIAVGQAVETDTAGVVTPDQQRVGQAVETDTAGTITPSLVPILTLPFRDDFDRADSTTEGNNWAEAFSNFEIASQRLKGDYTAGPLANGIRVTQTAGALLPNSYVACEALVWLTPDAFNQGSLYLFARADGATNHDEQDPCVRLRATTGGGWDVAIMYEAITGGTGVTSHALSGPVDSAANARRIGVSCEPNGSDLIVRGYLDGVEFANVAARNNPAIGYLAASAGGQTVAYFEWITADTAVPVPDPVDVGWTVGSVRF